MEHSCAIAAGTVYCWGYSAYGQAGYIATKNYATVVNEGSGVPFRGVSEVSIGSRHSCALKSGNVWCWGLDNAGQLGNDDNRINQMAPAMVVKSNGTALTGVEHISSGAFHSCALTTVGEVWCWGANAYGQIGDGTTGTLISGITGRNRAVQVLKSAGSALKNVTEISLGDEYTCALMNGETWCWGINDNGQLGDGTTTNRSFPVQVIMANGTPLTNVVAIDSGRTHTCAIANKRALCWGDNTSGQLGDGTFIDQLRAIVTGL
jgi:alpha-tubulin suppressor-like RCC1 family protein